MKQDLEIETGVDVLKKQNIRNTGCTKYVYIFIRSARSGCSSIASCYLTYCSNYQKQTVVILCLFYTIWIHSNILGGVYIMIQQHVACASLGIGTLSWLYILSNLISILCGFVATTVLTLNVSPSCHWMIDLSASYLTCNDLAHWLTVQYV